MTTWNDLHAHRQANADRPIAALFAAEPDRAAKRSTEACGMVLDWSKTTLDDRAVELLLDLAGLDDELAGADLVGRVTTARPYVVPARGEKRFTVVAVDLAGSGYSQYSGRYSLDDQSDLVLGVVEECSEEMWETGLVEFD